MNPLSIAGLGLGLVGGIGKLFGVRKSNKALDKLYSQDPTYTANPLASQRLALAQSLLNARMPGATNIERNIYGNQAQQISNINRNATDASQALALASGTQGQTNQAFNNLGIQEAQDFQRRYGNYSGALQGQIEEQQRAYQDQVRRFNDLAAIRGAQQQNRQNAWGSLSNMGMGIANFGLSGGLKGMFGGGGGGNMGGMPQMNPTGTFGYQGYMSPGLMNRSTPNFYQQWP